MSVVIQPKLWVESQSHFVNQEIGTYPNAKDVGSLQRTLLDRLLWVHSVGLGSRAFQEEADESQAEGDGLEDQNLGISVQTGVDDCPQPESGSDNVDGPEQQEEGGGRAGAGMVEVCEDCSDEVRDGLEGIELDDRDLDMAKRDEHGERCTRSCCSQQQNLQTLAHSVKVL